MGPVLILTGGTAVVGGTACGALTAGAETGGDRPDPTVSSGSSTRLSKNTGNTVSHPATARRATAATHRSTRRRTNRGSTTKMTTTSTARMTTASIHARPVRGTASLSRSKTL